MVQDEEEHFSPPDVTTSLPAIAAVDDGAPAVPNGVRPASARPASARPASAKETSAGKQVASQSLTQTLLMRVVELEDENRKLRSEVASLQTNYAAAASKNQLFKAKLLELQARLEGGGIMHVAGMRGPAPAPKKFRSPLVPKPDGSLAYRFERQVPPPRPSTARQRPPDLPPPSSQPHSARSAPTPRSYRVRQGPTLPVAAASANPNAVDRVYREHARIHGAPAGSHGASGRPGNGAEDSTGPGSNGNGGSDGKRAVEGAGERTGFEVLLEEVRAGRVGPETEMTLQIVYCVDAAQKAMTVRHNPAKYQDAAEQLRQGADVTFAEWKLAVDVIGKDWAAVPTGSPKQRGGGGGGGGGGGDSAGGWVGEKAHPPLQVQLGAFEVSLLWEYEGEAKAVLLHSKVKERKFPQVKEPAAALPERSSSDAKSRPDAVALGFHNPQSMGKAAFSVESLGLCVSGGEELRFVAGRLVVAARGRRAEWRSAGLSSRGANLDRWAISFNREECALGA